MRQLLFLAAALAAAAPAAAQQKLSPGLWENTMTMQQGGQSVDAMAQMQKQLEAMPPEQRKQMEQMMAQRGISVGAGGKGGAQSVKVCISPAQAERGDLPHDDGRCKRDAPVRSGNTLKFKFACTNPASSGEGSFTFSSDKAYSGQVVVDSMANGKPQRTEMQQTGRWLSADCGGLKPADATK